MTARKATVLPTSVVAELRSLKGETAKELFAVRRTKPWHTLQSRAMGRARELELKSRLYSLDYVLKLVKP